MYNDIMQLQPNKSTLLMKLKNGLCDYGMQIKHLLPKEMDRSRSELMACQLFTIPKKLKENMKPETDLVNNTLHHHIMKSPMIPSLPIRKPQNENNPILSREKMDQLCPESSTGPSNQVCSNGSNRIAGSK